MYDFLDAHFLKNSVNNNKMKKTILPLIVAFLCFVDQADLNKIAA